MVTAWLASTAGWRKASHRTRWLTVSDDVFAASQVAGGASFITVMIFPALFTAGMTLIDTTDSVLMVGAYGWAFLNPLRKIWYNLTITAISVLVALLIGGVEALK